MKCPQCDTDLQRDIMICPICKLEVGPLQRMGELPIYYWNLALKAIQQKDYLSALENLAVARALQPNFVQAFNLAGKVCIEMEQLNRAQYYFKSALTIDALNKEAKNALLWLSEQGIDVKI